jgi:HEAT repeat protein
MIRDIRDMDHEPTEAEKVARRAERAKREEAEVAALVKRLDEIPKGWNWEWRGSMLYYGPLAEEDRVHAAYALGHQYKAYSAIPDLAVALKDKDKDVRINAVSSLLEMADHAAPAQAALKEALNDPYYAVRLDAVRALLLMGVPNAELMPALVSVTASPDPCQAMDAVDLLLAMGRSPRDFVPALMTGIVDLEAGPRVITILIDYDEDPAYLPLLLKGLDSANAVVQAQSVILLGDATYVGPEATAAIRKAASSWTASLRAAAAHALVVGGYEDGSRGMVAGLGTGAANESIAKLLKLLSNRDKTVRQAAAESLGRSKDSSPEVIAALRVAAKDRDGDVAAEAAKALAAILSYSGAKAS